MVKHIEVIDANMQGQQVLIDGKALPGAESILQDSITVVPLGIASEVRLALIAERVTVTTTRNAAGVER